MSRFFGLALTLGLLYPGSLAVAQGDVMTELYGEGVHRYFAGDYTGAELALTQVIDSGSQDPRSHYFRGLCREMQGGGGIVDFESGAMLEAQGKRVVNVGQALIRIQGSTRSVIEKARRDARIQARQVAFASGTAPATPAMPTTPAAPSETGPASANTAPSVAEVANPFADGGLRSDATTEDSSQPAPATPDESNPFADDPIPPATDNPVPPADDNPFGGHGSDDNPFGGADAGDNPFGGDTSSDDIFGGSDAGDSPFGGNNPFDN